MGSARRTSGSGMAPTVDLLLLLPLLLGVTKADDSPMSVLRRTVFYNYDRNVIPQEHGSDSRPLTVELGFAPKWRTSTPTGC